MAGYGGFGLAARGYPVMAARADEAVASGHFLWCADIHEDSEELLYVDLVHYSPKLVTMIAQTIGEFILDRGLVPVDL